MVIIIIMYFKFYFILNNKFTGRIFKALKVRKTRNNDSAFERKSDNTNSSNNKNLFAEDSNRFVVVQVCKKIFNEMDVIYRA